MKRLTQNELVINQNDIGLDDLNTPVGKLLQEVNKRNQFFYHALTGIDEKVDQIQVELGIKQGDKIPQETRLDKMDSKLVKMDSKLDKIMKHLGIED